jgi:GNAT superfamily N-acetyltransferase
MPESVIVDETTQPLADRSSDRSAADLRIVEVDALDDDGMLAIWVETGLVTARADFGDRHVSFTEQDLREVRRTATDRDVVLLLALAGDRPVGQARLNLPLLDNRHFASGSLSVPSEHRRRGVGTALLADLERRARAAGRSTLCVEAEVPAGRSAPADGFAPARGYASALTELRSDLELPAGSLDPILADLEAEAAEPSAGYRTMTWWDEIPEEWLDQRARLSARISTDAPMGDLDMEEEVWDADRVREVVRVTRAQGRRMVQTIALLPGSEELVAYTILVTSHDKPDRAFQWDTLVLREHRGHRLGQLVKALNLRALRAELPDVRRVVTWNAEANAPMLRVNRAMGFVTVAVTNEWQKHL